MTSLPPLRVAVNGPRLNCVIDVALALSPGGFLFTLRLAEEANVFLGRELWYTLDNQDVDAFAPEVQAEFRLWKLARVDAHLNGLGLYWLGDCRPESLLPGEVDKQCLHRYENLSEILDDGSIGSGEGWGGTDHERCNLDTLALAGSLMPYRPLIFSSGQPESGLLAYLSQRMPLKQAPGADSRHARNQFRQLFFRNGISELLWHGLSLNVVHLVAPFAMVMPSVEPNKDKFWPALTDWDDEPPVNGWESAAAYWYPLAGGEA